jgi:hypothetical protein
MMLLRGWLRSWSACIVLALLAGAGVTVGCGKSNSLLDPQPNLSGLGLAAHDSVPPPHGPPPRPPAITAQFVSADPTQAGATGTSRWLLGNNSPKQLTMSWSVTGDSLWSAFPIQGSLTVDRRSTAPLNVAIPVPAGTVPGSYPLLLTVTSSEGAASAAGSITVVGDSLAAR